MRNDYRWVVWVRLWCPLPLSAIGIGLVIRYRPEPSSRCMGGEAVFNGGVEPVKPREWATMDLEIASGFMIWPRPSPKREGQGVQLGYMAR